MRDDLSLIFSRVARASVLVVTLALWITGPARAYTFVSLDFGGGTEARAINDHGMVVGAYDGHSQGFFYDSVTSGFSSYGAPIYGINNHNDVVGFSVGGSFYDRDGDGVFDKYLTDFATNQQVRDLNDNGLVVGGYELSGNSYREYHWDSNTDTYIDPPSYVAPPASIDGVTVIQMGPEGVNNHGDSVGFVNGASGNYGYVRTAGGSYSLFVQNAVLTDINDFGHIVGVVDGGWSPPVLYDGSSFHSFWYPGADVTKIHGINNLGQLVGLYQVGGERFGFVATPEAGDATFVSEPTLAILVMFGLLLGTRIEKTRRV